MNFRPHTTQSTSTTVTIPRWCPMKRSNHHCDCPPQTHLLKQLHILQLELPHPMSHNPPQSVHVAEPIIEVTPHRLPVGRVRESLFGSVKSTCTSHVIALGRLPSFSSDPLKVITTITPALVDFWTDPINTQISFENWIRFFFCHRPTTCPTSEFNPQTHLCSWKMTNSIAQLSIFGMMIKRWFWMMSSTPKRPLWVICDDLFTVSKPNMPILNNIMGWITLINLINNNEWRQAFFTCWINSNIQI